MGAQDGFVCFVCSLHRCIWWHSNALDGPDVRVRWVASGTGWMMINAFPSFECPTRKAKKCLLALLRALFFLLSSFNCSARVATSDCQLQSLVTGPKHSTPPMIAAAVEGRMSPMNSGRNQLHCACVCVCVCVHLLHLKSVMLLLLL